MFCKKCGKDIKDSQFCPFCGTEAYKTGNNANNMNVTSRQDVINSQIKKKKSKVGLFICLVIVGALCFGISQIIQNPEKYQNTISSEEWLEFDDKTWEQFSQLYTNHNNLMYAMTAFSDGNMDAASFYSYCKDFENICANNSLIFDYGVNQDQKDYLSVFKSATLSDQMAAQSLMKYLDTYQTSDLSEAQEHIQNAKDAITTIASNRGTLLAKTDLSEEEIQKRLNESLTMLE